MTVLITNFQGKYLNGPNDVWIAPNGAMYYHRPVLSAQMVGSHHDGADQRGGFLSLARPQKSIEVTDDLKKPNGITGTPDGKNFIVSDIGARQTWRYDIQPDGSLTNKTLICTFGSDGMTIDEQGNLYMTGRGVTVFDKTGKQIDHIDVPENRGRATSASAARIARRCSSPPATSFYSIHLIYKGANPAK